MTTTENKINPLDYFYNRDVNVEIPGGFLLELLALTDQLIKQEMKIESKFKYLHINDKDKIVKTFKQEDVASGKIRKMVDWEKTIENPSFEYSLTEKGIGYAQLKKFLESLHMDNINKGLAVTYSKSEDSVLNED